jgi:hypothetical protein
MEMAIAIKSAHKTNAVLSEQTSPDWESIGPDFARGQRTLPSAPEVAGFASGQRTLPPAMEGSDFARGQRKRPWVRAVADFAAGQRTSPYRPRPCPDDL